MALLLLIITILAILIQLGFWLGIFSRFPAAPKQSITELPPVSVLICARNEASNLQRLLPVVLEQDYPDFEVIVVDHASTDDTGKVLHELARSFPHLRLTHFEDHTPGKKGPLAKAWLLASHEWLVLTDADCRPASSQWLRALAKRMHPNHDFVLGYSPYLQAPGWLNRWVRFETALTAIQYISYAKSGIPYMGVGRNLAYRKSLLAQLGQDGLQPALLSGDDDLLVGKLAKPERLGFSLDPEAFTYSEAPTTWHSYLWQKTRHVSTAPYYRTLPKFLLGLWGASQLLWLPLLIVLHFLHLNLGLNLGLNLDLDLSLSLSLYFLRLLPAWWIFSRNARMLKEGSLAPWFPILDLGLTLYYLLLLPASLGWKERENWK